MMKSDEITDNLFEESAKRCFLKPGKDPKDLNSKERYERFVTNISHDLHDYFHRVEDDWEDNQREAEIARLGLPPTPKFNVTKRENDVVPLERLLENPGRTNRPARVLILIRGAPGSGKTYFAKKIMKKEEEMGGKRCKLISCNRYYAKRFNDEDVKCYKDYFYDELKEISEEGFYNFVVAEVEGSEMEYYTKLTEIASYIGGFEFYMMTIHQLPETCVKFCRHKRKDRDIELISREIDRTSIPHSHKVIDPKCILEKNPNDKPEGFDRGYRRDTGFGRRRRQSDSEEEDECFTSCVG